MVKSIVLDNGRFWGLILKRKNQRILLIHVLSHEAIISKAWHASYVIITSSVLLYLPHEQFSHGGEAGYSQEYAFSLKKLKIFWFPEVLLAKLIIPVCCFIHNHFPLQPNSYLQFWNLTLVSEIKSLVLAFLYTLYRLHWGIRQTYMIPS